MIKIFSILILFLSTQQILNAQSNNTMNDSTKIIFLGTGNPNPDPKHSGNSIAIVVNDQAYIVDFGPGLIRKAAELSPRYGGNIKALDVKNINIAFLTHLHSDHTTGLPDLAFTPWVMGREKPLEIYGPKGLKGMSKHILKAYKKDIKTRLHGLEPATENGWKINTHEFKNEGIIYKDSNVKVEAFKVEHGSWRNAYGYIFYTPDLTIAISGDTRPCSNLLEKCKGVDVLIHEVYSDEKLKFRTEFWQKYHPQFHTSTTEIAEIANKIKPKTLILYHQLYWGQTDEELIGEISRSYKGKIISAKDLGIY